MDRAIRLPPGSVWRVTGQTYFYINKFVGLPHRSLHLQYSHSVLILPNLCLLLFHALVRSSPPPQGWEEGEWCGSPGRRVEGEENFVFSIKICSAVNKF